MQALGQSAFTATSYCIYLLTVPRMKTYQWHRFMQYCKRTEMNGWYQIRIAQTNLTCVIKVRRGLWNKNTFRLPDTQHASHILSGLRPQVYMSGTADVACFITLSQYRPSLFILAGHFSTNVFLWAHGTVVISCTVYCSTTLHNFHYFPLPRIFQM